MTAVKMCTVHIYGPSLACMPRRSKVRLPANAGAEEHRSTNRRIEAMQEDNARAARATDAELVRNDEVLLEFKQRSRLVEHKKAQLALFEQTLKRAKTPEEKRGGAREIEKLKEELKELDVPTVAWIGDRREMYDYIDETSRQSKRAVERDAELAGLIAAKQRLEDDLLQIERNPRNMHLLRGALYEVRQAKDDIEKFVRPSAAAGGRRTGIQAPPYIQAQINVYMRMFTEVQQDRLEYMTSASPEKLRDMSEGVQGIDMCIQDLLDSLRATLDAHDQSADHLARTHRLARQAGAHASNVGAHASTRGSGRHINDAARGLRLLNVYDPKNEAKLAAMRQELLEMDLQIAQKSLQELELDRTLDPVELELYRAIMERNEDIGSRAAGS